MATMWSAALHAQQTAVIGPVTYSGNKITKEVILSREMTLRTGQVMTLDSIGYHMERSRSMDYLDYQRTRYIRGEQDWVGAAEGGAVIRAEGSAYWNFRGELHGLQPINSRELWEQHIEGRW